jgi:hypothetical protein
MSPQTIYSWINVLCLLKKKYFTYTDLSTGGIFGSFYLRGTFGVWKGRMLGVMTPACIRYAQSGYDCWINNIKRFNTLVTSDDLHLEAQELPPTKIYMSPGISSVDRKFILNSNTYSQPIVRNVATFCGTIAIFLAYDSSYRRHP